MPTDSAQAIHVDPIPEAPFYIAVTDSAWRGRCTLKSGDTFLVMDTHGDVGASSGGPDGLFHCDTRHLSRLELTVNEVSPLLLGSNLRDDNALLAIDLTNPDIFSDQRIVMQKDTLHIVRTVFLWRGVAYQRLGLRNFGDRTADLRLRILFDSDFAWKIDRVDFWSKTKNSPFDERPVQGRVLATIVGGRTIYRDDGFASAAQAA